MVFMLASWPVFWYLDRLSNVMEVYANNVLIWSKVTEGRLPTDDDGKAML